MLSSIRIVIEASKNLLRSSLQQITETTPSPAKKKSLTPLISEGRVETYTMGALMPSWSAKVWQSLVIGLVELYYLALLSLMLSCHYVLCHMLKCQEPARCDEPEFRNCKVVTWLWWCFNDKRFQSMPYGTSQQLMTGYGNFCIANSPPWQQRDSS